MSCTHRREDLEDILADPAYFQAIFHSLPSVRSLFQAQAELGSANESIASTLQPTTSRSGPAHYIPDNNTVLQERLYRLRSETQDAFNEAKSLEARWKDLEREQREVYQVCFLIDWLHGIIYSIFSGSHPSFY